VKEIPLAPGGPASTDKSDGFFVSIGPDHYHKAPGNRTDSDEPIFKFRMRLVIDLKILATSQEQLLCFPEGDGVLA